MMVMTAMCENNPTDMMRRHNNNDATIVPFVLTKVIVTVVRVI
jgi:hypothetical protein